MAQMWPASVTTEPGVAGGAAAALLLVSYMLVVESAANPAMAASILVFSFVV
jgi:hypothetical protein